MSARSGRRFTVSAVGWAEAFFGSSWNTSTSIFRRQSENWRRASEFRLSRNVAGDEEDRQHEARRTLLKLHAEAAEWFHENLLKKELAEPARTYLKKRGIDRQIAKDWQLGFAPEQLGRVLEMGARARLLAGAASAKRVGQTARRKSADRRNLRSVPGPNHVPDLQRCWRSDCLQRPPARSRSPGSQIPEFAGNAALPKGRCLFGLHKTKRGLIDANCAIVCEGQLDLITCSKRGSRMSLRRRARLSPKIRPGS